VRCIIRVGQGRLWEVPVRERMRLVDLWRRELDGLRRKWRSAFGGGCPMRNFGAWIVVLFRESCKRSSMEVMWIIVGMTLRRRAI
jgi:hypothetical protein